MAEPRLEVKTLKIRQLIDDYRAARIAVPEFQREYVWNLSDASGFIESLLLGLPVPGIFLAKEEK